MTRLKTEVSPSEEASFFVFLTERANCHYFEALADPSQRLLPTEYRVRRIDTRVFSVADQCERQIYFVAGRQLATAERLEILALDCAARFPEKLSLPDALAAIIEAGGVPVLNWSPGKWLFERGKHVRALIERSSGSDFLLGDISIRPGFWGEPGLFALAKSKGFRIVSGSDPLPLPGEEVRIGSYGVAVRLGTQTDEPGKLARRLLLDSSLQFATVGSRNTSVEAASRLLRNQRARSTYQSSVSFPLR